MLDSHLIHQYYTNPSYCNVLQNINENQVKEELKDIKIELELKGHKNSWVCLSEETARLGEPVTPFEDS